MLKSTLMMLGYGTVLLFGFRSLLAYKRMAELVLFVLLIGWCAYIQLAALNGWPVITPITLQSDLMERINRLL